MRMFLAVSALLGSAALLGGCSSGRAYPTPPPTSGSTLHYAPTPTPTPAPTPAPGPAAPSSGGGACGAGGKACGK